MKTLTDIVDQVVNGLLVKHQNDAPLIRQSLNDALVAAVARGEISVRKAHSCNRAYTVKRIQAMLKFRERGEE